MWTQSTHKSVQYEISQKLNVKSAERAHKRTLEFFATHSQCVQRVLFLAALLNIITEMPSATFEKLWNERQTSQQQQNPTQTQSNWWRKESMQSMAKRMKWMTEIFGVYFIAFKYTWWFSYTNREYKMFQRKKEKRAYKRTNEYIYIREWWGGRMKIVRMVES